MSKIIKYLIFTCFTSMLLGTTAMAATTSRMFTTESTVVYDSNLNVILNAKDCPDYLGVNVTGTKQIGDNAYYIVELGTGYETIIPSNMLTSKRSVVTIEDLVNADPTYINKLIEKEMVEFEFDKAGGKEVYSFNGNTVVLKCYYTDALLKAYNLSFEEMQKVLQANVSHNIKAITETANRIYEGYGIYPEMVTEIDFLGDNTLCTTVKNFTAK